MKHPNIKFILSVFFAFSILGLMNSGASASTFTPSELKYTINQEDFKFDEIKYKNDSTVVENIILTVSSYDEKNKVKLDTKPFFAIEEANYTVKPGQEISIPTLATIPKDTPIGTYFNAIYLQQKVVKKGSPTTTTEPTLVMLVTFHVQSETTRTDEVFFDQSDITLAVKNKGLPFIAPTEIEYTYTNNSNFVFKPEGEIKISDDAGNQIGDKLVINSEKKVVFPGESITQTYTVTPWNDIQSILSTKNILSTTVSDIDNTPVMNKIEISILYQCIIIAVVALVLFIAIIALLVMIIKGLGKSKKKESTNEKVEVTKTQELEMSSEMIS